MLCFPTEDNKSSIHPPPRFSLLLLVCFDVHAWARQAVLANDVGIFSQTLDIVCLLSALKSIHFLATIPFPDSVTHIYFLSWNDARILRINVN